MGVWIGKDPEGRSGWYRSEYLDCRAQLGERWAFLQVNSFSPALLSVGLAQRPLPSQNKACVGGVSTQPVPEDCPFPPPQPHHERN